MLVTRAVSAVGVGVSVVGGDVEVCVGGTGIGVLVGGLGVGVAVGFGVAVLVLVGVGVTVSVGSGVGVSVGSGVKVGVGVGGSVSVSASAASDAVVAVGVGSVSGPPQARRELEKITRSTRNFLNVMGLCLYQGNPNMSIIPVPHMIVVLPSKPFPLPIRVWFISGMSRIGTSFSMR